MRQDLVHLNTFEKINYVKELINTTVGEIDGNELSVILCHIAHIHTDKNYKKELNEKEMLLYDMLLRNDLNPSTVYKWFLVTRTPSDIKSKLRRGLISQREALKLNTNRRRMKEASIGLEILEEARSVVRGV